MTTFPKRRAVERVSSMPGASDDPSALMVRLALALAARAPHEDARTQRLAARQVVGFKIQTIT